MSGLKNKSKEKDRKLQNLLCYIQKEKLYQYYDELTIKFSEYGVKIDGKQKPLIDRVESLGHGIGIF